MLSKFLLLIFIISIHSGLPANLFAQGDWWDDYYGRQIGSSFQILSEGDTFRGGTFLSSQNTYHWAYAGSDSVDMYNGFNLQSEQYMGASPWIPFNGNQNPNGIDTTLGDVIGSSSLYGLGNSNSGLTTDFATGWTPGSNNPFAGSGNMGDVGFLAHGSELNGFVLVGGGNDGVAGILTPGQYMQPLHGNVPGSVKYVSRDQESLAGQGQNALWTKTGPDWDDFSLFDTSGFDTSGLVGLPGEWDAFDEAEVGSSLRVAIGLTQDINTFSDVLAVFNSDTGEQLYISPEGLELDTIGYQMNMLTGKLELFGAMYDPLEMDSYLINFNTGEADYWEQIYGTSGRIFDLELGSNIVIFQDASGGTHGVRLTSVPEPSAFVFLTLFAITCAGRRPRYDDRA